MSNVSGQVEEYVEELNGLAAQVKRNLALVGTLDQGSHGKLEELKAAQAAYLLGLKERVKAEKGKAAAGAELQAATVDEAALAHMQELEGEVVGKSEEKLQVAARMEEMVRDALAKLESFMAQYQEELRSAGKWGEGVMDDELDLDEDLTASTPMARHFSVGGDAAPAASVVRQASAAFPAALGREASVPELAGTGLGSIPMPPSMASVAANVMNLSNQAALEQHGLVANPLAHAATLADMQVAVAAAAQSTATSSATHNAQGAPLSTDTPTYCVCKRVALGKMIGCDNDDCPYEWFHLPCVNLSKAVDGTWFCPKCVENMRKVRDSRLGDMKEGHTAFVNVSWETMAAMAEVEEAA